MAIFNPQIPDTNDPNWLGWSKSITQPEGDKSTGISLTTAAEGLGEGLKLADTSMKSIIEDEIYTKAKQEQQDYQTTLQNARDTVRTAQLGTQAAAPGAPPLNIMSADTSSSPGVPNSLKNLTYDVDGLGNARANGKLSETDYAMRLDTMAKDFRARYPGYKEYIDATFQKVTGIDAANKMITSSIQDINTFLGGADAQKKAALAFLLRDDTLTNSPKAAAAALGLQNGTVSISDAYAAGLEGYAQKGVSARLKRDLEDAQNTRAMTDIYAERWANHTAANYVSDSINGIIVYGVGGPKKFEDFAREHAPGTGREIDPARWGELEQVLEFNKGQTRSQLLAQFNKQEIKIGDSSKPISLVQLKGIDYVNKLIDEHLKIYEPYQTAITKKDVGLLHTATMRNNAEMSQTVSAIFQNIPAARVLGAYNHFGGPNFAQEMATKNIREFMLPFQDKQKFDAIQQMAIGQPRIRTVPGTGPTITTPPPYKPTPFTLKEALTQAKVDPANPGSEVLTSPQLNEAITKLPKLMLNKDLADEGKIGLVMATFSKENRGMIDSIKPDGTTKDGKPISGKMYVFSSIASPDIIKEVKRLDASNPEMKLWDQTKRWIGETFAQELFPNEIANFNGIAANPKIKLDWDDTSHQFIHNLDRSSPLFTGKSRFFDYGEEQRLQTAGRALNRLNDGLRSIANVYKEDGKDPNAGIYNYLTGLGMKIDGSLAGSMFKAVETTVKGAQPKPKEGEKLNYDVEQAPSSGNVLPDAQRGSLMRFLDNPAGEVPYRMQSAQTASRTRSNSGSTSQRSKPSINLSEQPLVGVGAPESVPEGMSPAEYIRRTK